MVPLLCLIAFVFLVEYRLRKRVIEVDARLKEIEKQIKKNKNDIKKLNEED